LADAAGNALEVAYAVEYLTGARREPRMHEIVMALCAEMLVTGKLARTQPAARKQLQRALDTGAAAEIFGKMVAALGGPRSFVEAPWKHMDRAEVVIDVLPDREGTVSRIDTRAVGLAVVSLGGGRTRPQDPVDHAVGLTSLAGVGDEVGLSRPLAVVHARTSAAADQAAAEVRAAYRIGGRAAALHEPILDRVTSPA
jgi:thymidine phosphorylase